MSDEGAITTSTPATELTGSSAGEVALKSATGASPGRAPNRDVRRLRSRLERLARDAWWTWNVSAQRPFAALDPETWEWSRHSPLAVLAQASDAVLRHRAGDPEFVCMVDEADAARRAAQRAPSWFEERHPEASRLLVAYFCSEFALHESIPQYAGGLGVLAGDHLKSAADLGIPVIGVGLLYGQGYYRQEFGRDGSTEVIYPGIDRALLPLRRTGVDFECPIGGRAVQVRVWRMRLGRTRLYLLDADRRGNRPSDRLLTRGLYRGDPDLRLRQQVLLGIGGAMALEALGEPVTVLHLNEGHAAFAAIERTAQLVRRGQSLEEALILVRHSTVFTTHTPVAAGHDRYDMDTVERLLRPTLRRARMSSDVLRSLGQEQPGRKEKFCMTALALRLAEHSNGVAALHGRVTREAWKHIYDRTEPAQVPIGHITNGIHLPTWVDPAASDFWRAEAGIDISAPNLERDPWTDAVRVDPRRLWTLRGLWRRRLIREVRRLRTLHARRTGETPEEILHAGEILRDDALTIGFARRFATYKRAPLLFSDLDRVARLLADADRPVQVLFAGKAHPRDVDGQAFARRIHAMTLDPRFRGRVVLLEEYDMGLARLLVSGCDLWLNTPIRPHEASGTSGMKVAAHGGINLSIPDGWWPEAADGRNGWTIGSEAETPTYPKFQEQQDRLDSEALYDLLEREVIPEFFDRAAGGIPEQWMARALRSAATIPGRFNTNRMVAEYLAKAYLPAQPAE